MRIVLSLRWRSRLPGQKEKKIRTTRMFQKNRNKKQTRLPPRSSSSTAPLSHTLCIQSQSASIIPDKKRANVNTVHDIWMLTSKHPRCSLYVYLTYNFFSHSHTNYFTYVSTFFPLPIKPAFMAKWRNT